MKNTSFRLRLLLTFILAASIIPLFVSAQHQSGGVPLSFGRALKAENVINSEITPPSPETILQIEKAPALPYRFAIRIPVDFSLSTSGTTEILNDGQMVWRLSFHSSAAKALMLYFDRFSIPAGGRLFVYNTSRTQMYGAYTSANNNSFGTFACPLITGESLVLEYNAPASLALPDIHISDVAYAFRGIVTYEDEKAGYSAGKCEVNVNCSEGLNWQKQKRGVVKLVVKDSNSVLMWCSGSMINNTSNDGTPYLLTANHCGKAARAVDLSQWLFYFNYEMPGCENTTAAGSSLLGAMFKAHGLTEDAGSDFFLVKLSESIPDSLNVYFNGWNRTEAISNTGTGIHHPGGDVKKISTYNFPLSTGYWTGNPNPCFWLVYWTYTTHGHGVTEGGSSGSPIFNAAGQIVGTLTGGDSNCDTNSLNLPDYYGKFSWHWDKNGTDSAHILKCWLDPNNTNVTDMGGWALGIKDQNAEPGIRLYPNPARETSNISLDGESLSKGGLSISVLDILGNPCPASTVKETDAGMYSLDLQSLSPGVYLVVISGQNFRKSMKLLKM